MKIIGYIALGVVGIFGLLLVSHHFNMADPKYRARVQLRDSIDACWQEQSRKSHSPDVARFIAATCESLEARLRDMPR